jgi:ABC-type lipopolysaccharide export system ATPase subunit
VNKDDWNRRYAERELVWSAGPNRFLVSEAGDLEPGRALDLACGEGRNAIWLAERRSQKAGTMSGGEQQMCAIGRALMARPSLLLLDEPSMGLAPIFVERIFETVVEVNRQGTTILLVEQNALMALDVASRGYVLETGAIALADDAKALRENEQVRKTYLGEGD